MKNRIVILVLLMTCASRLYVDAQVNLVLNPSFEVYSNIPYDFNQIQFAKYWSPIDSNGNPDMPGSTPICTPELISTLDTGASGVHATSPKNPNFYHYPRTGNAMCQMDMYSTGVLNGIDNYYRRDYTQGRLNTPLSESVSYCVTFYVALEQVDGFAVNNIGAYIDGGAIDTGMYDTCCLSTLYVLDTYCTQPKTMYTPQILETSVVLDTLGRATNDSVLYERRWVKIQGSFVAAGGERYITIGLFADDAHTTIIPLPPPPPYFYISGGWGPYRNVYSIYLIDDVSLVRSDARASAGPDIATSPGLPVYIGNDTAAVGGGDGMPCWWYVLSRGVLSTSPIDSGGRIKVSPDTTTTYVEMMDLCGNVTYDTVTVWVWPLSSPIPGPSPQAGKGGAAIVVSPNPAREVLHIEYVPLHTKYVIVNLVGQLMQGGEVQEKTINIQMLQAGMYFIELTDEDGNKKTMKFIKM